MSYFYLAYQTENFELLFFRCTHLLCSVSPSVFCGLPCSVSHHVHNVKIQLSYGDLSANVVC